MAKKKAKRGSRVTKSDFIRARPTASAQEIVEAAKAEGITITRNAVHKIRWQVKQQELLHPPKKASSKWERRFRPPKAKNGEHVKDVAVKSGNGISIEATEEEWKGLDEAATAMLGGIGAAVKKLVRSEVRAEVRRIMGAGVET